MGFVAHTDSTKTKPVCTTVEACNFTNDTNIGDGGSSGTGEVADVPEWMIITISFAAITIIGLMLICYLLCPHKQSARKINYVIRQQNGEHISLQGSHGENTKTLQLVLLDL